MNKQKQTPQVEESAVIESLKLFLYLKFISSFAACPIRLLFCILYFANAPSYHTGEDFVPDLRCYQRRLLASPIIRWRYFDDIGTDNIQALETAKNSDHLAARPAAGFGRACSRTLRGTSVFPVS